MPTRSPTSLVARRAGYRAALDYLFTEDWRPLNVDLVLHLHRLLWKHTAAGGDRPPAAEIRFVPVPARPAPGYTQGLVGRYADEARRGAHPVLFIGLFVLDLLTIHPFADGNDRVVRAVTNALLDDAGYGVGPYVSLEQILADSVEAYYEALRASTHGWHTDAHDPWPWLGYFISTLTTAYDSFEGWASSDRSTGTEQDRVRDYVVSHAAAVFKISDVRVALPGISDPTIRLALESLKRDGRITPEGDRPLRRLAEDSVAVGGADAETAATRAPDRA